MHPYNSTGVRGEIWGVIGGRTNDNESVIHLLSAATLVECVYELAADGHQIVLLEPSTNLGLWAWLFISNPNPY
jgi:hypothetical protein